MDHYASERTWEAQVDSSLSHDRFVEDLLDAAQEHGINDLPDHEVGDVQTFLRACWAVMSREQRLKAMADSDVQNVFEILEYEGLFEGWYGWKDWAERLGDFRRRHGA